MSLTLLTYPYHDICARKVMYMESEPKLSESMLDQLDFERRSRVLWRRLSYVWTELIQGSQAQKEWADGIRNQFIMMLCNWLANMENQYAPEDFQQRLKMLESKYINKMRHIDSAVWWIEHYHNCQYRMDWRTGEGWQRFLEEGAAWPRDIRNKPRPTEN
jgi:hypothetical protein